ncbi:MAG: asparagine synthase (glutamine-hydrolyzing) [Chitinispirillaceae bacterium]
MCGITGIYNCDPAFRADRDLLRAMTGSLSHRGPDDQGFYFGEGVGLGQRRLSIIDIAGGKQPVHNEDRSVWTVFNGEIFNYLELMDLLKARGHRFYTRSDTEVLVHLYEEYGESFVEKCNGQFAIAVWDSRRRRLVLARDRAGIRPLYYTVLENGTVLFGSEIKALFSCPEVKRGIDLVALEQIFTLWVTVPPRTIFSGVKELAPGCIARIGTEGTRVQRYWKHSFPDRDGYEERPLSFYTARLRELMASAVDLRLRADVPVAAYLSGGLDSSIITALARRHHTNDLLTFSVAFRDGAFDERKYQQMMASRLGTDHRMVEVDYQDISDLFGKVVYHAESPMIRTAPAPLFALSRLVRENGIKVVLTGEGADEVFGGYGIFKESRIRRFWARVPDSQIRARLLGRVYPFVAGTNRSGAFWQMFFKRGLTDTENPYYSHILRWSNTSRLKRFLSKDIRESFDQEHHVFGELENYLDPDMHRWDPFCQAQYLELVLFMSGYLLSSQGDRMMMGNSVEGRFPFLDYRVMEFAHSMPPRLKLNVLNEKYILKKAFGELVPEEICLRPKQPYRAPIARCFTPVNDNTSSLMFTRQYLENSSLFDIQGVTNLMTKIESGDGQVNEVENMAVAAIASTQLLHHHFLQDSPPLSHAKGDISVADETGEKEC